MDRRGHDRHVEGVAGLKRQVRVELLAPLVPGLATAIGLVGAVLRVLGLLLTEHVVLLEGGLNGRQRHATVLGELLHVLVGLHDAAALVVLAVPLDLGGGLGVQAEEEARAVAQHETLVLPHHARDVVAAAKLVAEALAVDVQEHAAHAAQSLRGKELHLRIGLLGVHQGRGVHLDPLEVNAIRADRQGHLQAIARAVVTVRGGQVRKVRAVLVDQRVRREVGTEAARANDHGTILREGLAVRRDALAAADVAVLVREELLHRGLHHHARALRSRLADLLKLLHETVGDRHAREALLAAVRAGVRVTAEARDEAQVHAEGVNDPVDRRRALLAEHAHEVGPARATAHAVLREDLRVVLNLQGTLRLRERTVDAARGLGAVAAEEGVLVDHQNVAAMLQHSVRGGQAAEAAANDDHLLHRCRVGQCLTSLSL
mmetsp:Transcript_16094/g.48353  ORF Transcript_16094/g.48353 Transcript_16094/m.48353 type:complete len:431 (-) Transcript_16094:9-1301(-)